MIEVARLRAVYDCNVLFQALISSTGPAARCVDAAVLGRVELYLTRHALDEFWGLATRPAVIAKFGYPLSRAVLALENIERVAHVLPQVPKRFTLERDPSDAHYIDLALVANATVIVTRDRDLLDLCDPAHPDGRRFMATYPSLRIITPPALLAQLVL